MIRKSIFRHLYVQVLVAILLGAIIGHFYPGFGVKLKPLGDGFIKLIRMVVAPIIFTTVVLGIAGISDLKRVGRIGIKALIYFEVMTTLALVIGWLVVKAFQPGADVNADLSTLDASKVQSYITTAKTHGAAEFLLNIIPTSIVGAFAQGDILQVLFISVLFGIALGALGEANRPVVYALEQISNALMKIIGMIVRLAPVAALGAIAFMVGEFGIRSLVSVGKLMACVYITCLLFTCVLLGGLMRLSGVSLWKFIKYIREEIFIVLGTASSESVLPRMMTKMEALGCSQSLVRLVLPGGYSFNLDGSSIYLTMGALFIAQATNTHLTFGQELTLLAVCLVTSKGAAGVVGSAFIALAATLSSMHTIPIEGMVLILGVDRLMSEARAVTNLIGNGVATVVIARWENDLDDATASRVLNAPPSAVTRQASPAASEKVPVETAKD
ncbi:MAG TPA: dicarboxylate/amino acid:cation symporter [Candidatus Binatia bacterium]|nr:dicarboxylate/amino acid:cation symporter [Candidatus Binatia bacterium]